MNYYFIVCTGIIIFLVCVIFWLACKNVELDDRNESLGNAGEHTRKMFIELNKQLDEERNKNSELSKMIDKLRHPNKIRDSMKNFEKYQDELMLIIDSKSNDDFWNKLDDFCKKHCIDPSDNFTKELLKWLYEDYNLSELFSVKERNILKMLGNQYRWVGRTKNGKLFISTVEIPKYYIDDCVIATPDLYKYIEMFNDSFKNVTYENSPIRFR